MELTLNPKRVILIMLSIITLLTIMHIGQLVIYFQVGDPETFDFIKMIDFDYEANFPSFYSSSALLFCAALLWLIGLHKLRTIEQFRYHWIGLAAIFTFLAMDEAIALHEDLGDFVEALQLFDASGFLYFAWVAPYGILLILFAATYLKFVFTLPRQTMVTFICAGTLFIGGAVGIEIFSAREADANGTETILYSILYTVEEVFEMVGIAIFCFGILRYIETDQGHVKIHLKSKT